MAPQFALTNVAKSILVIAPGATEEYTLDDLTSENGAFNASSRIYLARLVMEQGSVSITRSHWPSCPNGAVHVTETTPRKLFFGEAGLAIPAGAEIQITNLSQAGSGGIDAEILIQLLVDR